jgi:hypothetical protein
MSNHRPLRLLLAILAAVALLAAACGDDDDEGSSSDTTEATDTSVEMAETDEEMTETDEETTTTAAAAGFEGDLAGVFEITAGACDDAGVATGSTFRMVQAGGTPEDGPFMDNADSTCTADLTFTPLSPGADGGLMTGDYQPAPDPAFDEANAALADAITEPVTFFGSTFGTATNPVDPQTSEDVPAPAITAADGTLSGDVSAMAAYWGGEVFNQGAPKPAGSEPGPIGTIDPETGEYVLDWSSQIVGGAFNDFIGVWHLEGTFTAG